MWVLFKSSPIRILIYIQKRSNILSSTNSYFREIILVWECYMSVHMLNKDLAGTHCFQIYPSKHLPQISHFFLPCTERVRAVRQSSPSDPLTQAT